MQSHFKKENEVILSYRWQFQDGRSKGMGTLWQIHSDIWQNQYNIVKLKNKIK